VTWLLGAAAFLLAGVVLGLATIAPAILAVAFVLDGLALAWIGVELWFDRR
jgi:hypothetical protein